MGSVGPVVDEIGPVVGGIGAVEFLVTISSDVAIWLPVQPNCPVTSWRTKHLNRRFTAV